MKSTKFQIRDSPAQVDQQSQVQQEYTKTDKRKVTISENPVEKQQLKKVEEKEESAKFSFSTVEVSKSNYTITSAPYVARSLVKEDNNDEVEKHIEEKLSPYERERLSFLAELQTFEFGYAEDSRQLGQYKPQTLLDYQSHEILCFSDECNIANMDSITEIVKELKKGQRPNIAKNNNFTFPKLELPESKDALVPGDINSEYYHYQNLGLAAKLSGYFGEFSDEILQTLNKLGSENIEYIVKQLVVYLLEFYETAECNQVPKLMLFCLIDQIILKAGLEKNFISIYVQLFKRVVEQKEIVDIVMSNSYDVTEFKMKVPNCENSDLLEKKRTSYLLFVFRQLIELNMKHQLSLGYSYHDIFKAREGDTSEMVEYKRELNQLYRFNIYKLFIELYLEQLIDAKTANEVLTELIGQNLSKLSIDERQFQIKIICEILQILLRESTWEVDLYFIKRYSNAAESVSDSVESLAKEYFQEPDFHAPYLQQFFNRNPEYEQNMDKIVSKSILLQRDLGKSAFEAYQAKIAGISGVDALTSFYIREVQYNHDKRFTHNSAVYKEYSAHKESFSRMQKADQKIVKQEEIMFTDKNIQQFTENLQDSSLLEALMDTFQYSEEQIKKVQNWSGKLSSMLRLQRCKNSTTVYNKLLKFLVYLNDSKINEQFLFSDDLANKQYQYLIQEAISEKVINFVDYCKFIVTFPDKSNFINNLFDELIHQEVDNDEEDEVDAEELFQNICVAGEVNELVTIMLTFEEKEKTINNAYAFLRDNEILCQFANFCKSVALEELFGDKALVNYLQNAQFYKQIISRAILENNAKCTIDLLFALRKPTINIIMDSAISIFHENCGEEAVLYDFFSQVLHYGATTKDELSGYVSRNAFGPIKPIKQSEKISAAWQ